jgi:hypothetical protein
VDTSPDNLRRHKMQTLGLSDLTPRSESRLKSLFWPSIHTASDVDYLGAQGYWVCAIIAALSFVLLAFTGQWITGAVVLLFYFVGGVGVRERSQYAAVIVLVMYVLDTLVTGPSIVRVIVGALLLSNLRATWIASRWKPESDEGVLPPRLDETWSDRFADALPTWLWPKVRIPYYIFSFCLLALVVIGLTGVLNRP